MKTILLYLPMKSNVLLITFYDPLHKIKLGIFNIARIRIFSVHNNIKVSTFNKVKDKTILLSLMMMNQTS